MKVIFLDVDGVLNTEEHFANRQYVFEELNESKFPLLKRIIDATGAILVLSSSWRTAPQMPDFKELLRLLAKNGMKLTDITKELHVARGREIKEWLSRHKVESFVILDDEDDMGSLSKTNLVQTEYWFGLSERDVEQAIEILNS